MKSIRRTKRKGKWTEQKGSVLVEAALVLPIFLSILFFLVDIGVYYIYQYAINAEVGDIVRRVTLNTTPNTPEREVARIVQGELDENRKKGGWLSRASDIQTAVQKEGDWASPYNEPVFRITVTYTLKSAFAVLPSLLGSDPRRTHSYVVKPESKKPL